jgi:hypothetical protein
MYRRGAWHDYPKWSRHCERATTENEVDIWSDWPESGIGIAAGRVIGIDIDVLDGEIAAKIEGLAKRMLGDTSAPPVRVGRAPKRLLVYRAAAALCRLQVPRPSKCWAWASSSSPTASTRILGRPMTGRWRVWPI